MAEGAIHPNAGSVCPNLGLRWFVKHCQFLNKETRRYLQKNREKLRTSSFSFVVDESAIRLSYLDQRHQQKTLEQARTGGPKLKHNRAISSLIKQSKKLTFTSTTSGILDQTLEHIIKILDPVLDDTPRYLHGERTWNFLQNKVEEKYVSHLNKNTIDPSRWVALTHNSLWTVFCKHKLFILFTQWSSLKWNETAPCNFGPFQLSYPYQ